MNKSGFTASVRRLFRTIRNDWSAFRENPRVLKPCRFPIIMVMVVSAAMIIVPQGQDLLLGMAEHLSDSGYGCGPMIFFMQGALVWAAYSWYWARVMLYMNFTNIPGNDPKFRDLRNHIPRVIGFTALAMTGVAFLKALWDYHDFLEKEMPWLLGLLALAFFVMAVLFLTITTRRRDWMDRTRKKLQKKSAPAQLVRLFTVTPGRKVKYGTSTIKDLPPAVMTAILISSAITVCFFIIFVKALQQAAPVIGAAAIVLFAAAGWVTVGSLVDYAGLRFRIPALGIVLVLVMIFSAWNDNHAVRTMPRKCASPRLSLEKSLDAWYGRQKNRDLASPERPCPFFIAAAEGGGIRAAYWTASVLDAIQHDNPGFANSLFAISSVSGGSLGSAVFLAHLSDVPADRAGARYEQLIRTEFSSVPHERLVQEILGEDFLAPAVGAMVLPDLLQRLMPCPIQCFDRARALERAWEQSWKKHAGNDLFSREFLSMWGKEGDDTWNPALFLNSTWVETGKRIIISNVLIGKKDFNDTEDLVALYERKSFKPENRTFPLSTAVHLSARFPYVSPAGTLTDGTTVYGRAVDGGYFENSGETTVLEILKSLDHRPWRDKVQPIVIHITNEPVEPGYEEVPLAKKKKDDKTRPKSCMNELISPILTILNARNARAVYAWKTVRWHVGESNFMRFRLCRDRKLNLPLGWVLSGAVKQEIRRQLGFCVEDDANGECLYVRNPAKKVICDNKNNFSRIGDILEKGFVPARTGK